MDGYVTIGTELDLSGIEQKLDQMVAIMENKTSAGAEKAAAKASKKLAAGMTVGISILTNVVNKAMSAVTSSISGAISRTDTLNNFSNVMSSLGVSSKDASESIDYMSEKLLGLPTTLDQGAMAVKRFTSANNNVKASTEMFLALNNALLAGGAPMQQQAAALEQMSQAYSKNKPDMMEWRTILSAMPAQLNQVAKEMGFGANGATRLGEALRKGDVSMNDFMMTFVKLNNMKGPESLAEQAKKGTNGIQTAVANLKNAVVRAVAEVIETIGHENIVRFINNIQRAIVGLFPYIAAFVRSFVVAVNVIASVIGKIAGLFGGLFGKKQKKNTKDTATGIGDVSYAIGGVGSSADKAAGKAKKLSKELGNLQGFDEMNVLQEPSSSDGGGGGGGADGGAGDLGDLGDLGNFDFGNISKQIKDLAAGTDLFTAAVWGLIAAWAAFKLTGDLLKSAGIGLIVMGLVYTIEKVLAYLKEPTWENFGKILLGIGIIVAGVALVFGGMAALITGIVLVIAAIGLAVYKNWDKIKAVLATVGKWIDDNVITPVVNFFKGLWEKIKAIFTPVINFFGGIIGTVIDNIKITIDNIKQILKALWEVIKAIFGPVFKWFYDTVIKPIADKFTALWDGIKTGVKAAADIVKSIFNGVVNFFKNIVNTIVSVFKTIGKKVGDAIGKAFKGAINLVLNAIENILNTPINAINGLIGAVNKLPGISLTKLKTFKLPRLAKGGIVNLPGNGVPIGSAVAGERGAEGVIPLTDSQQMAMLGEAIGKYITINANITNTMNGRVISRELKTIQNESDFAFNR